MVKEPLLTSREMRAIEVNAEYFGVSRIQLMENAGRSVAEEVASRVSAGKTVAVFCGLGGNGGDGFVIARHLSSLGFNILVVVAGTSKAISDSAVLANWNALQVLKPTISIHEVTDSSLIPKIHADVVVDALLGTGTIGRLRPPFFQLVKNMNAISAFRVAVDVPTGINADTGEVLGEAVKADVTVTFHRLKKGLAKAKKYVGEVVVKDIGIPQIFETITGPGDVFLVSKSRPSESHKGDFGRLLVIGGSDTFSGAPSLVALAALRTGVDLAIIAAPEKTAYAISSLSPDLITIKLQGRHLSESNIPTLKAHIEAANAIVLGPGLGMHVETKAAVRTAVQAIERAEKPLLLDADGLKAFAEFKRKLSIPLVLTPHEREYSILAGKSPSSDFRERVFDVQKTAAELGGVVLLKGAVDIISDEVKSKINFTGNPGMTVGGTGDVLSGILGGFLAQQVTPFEAAVAAAYVNGAAGDLMFEQKGYHIVASDLIDIIPQILENPMNHLKVRNRRG